MYERRGILNVEQGMKKEEVRMPNPASGILNSGKNDTAVFVNQDAVLQVAPDGAGKDDFFQIFSFANKVADGFAMGYTDDVLGDNGAFVQVGSNVVTGGADNFYAALVGGMVGACSGKGR